MIEVPGRHQTRKQAYACTQPSAEQASHGRKYANGKQLALVFTLSAAVHVTLP